jgi:hypothetical protein
MAKFAAILLALSLAAGGALAASPEAAYLAARDKYIAEIRRPVWPGISNARARLDQLRSAEDCDGRVH